MGNFIEVFITSGSARSAYLKGIEHFGFAPVESYIDDPGKDLPRRIDSAVRGALENVDRATHLERAVFIGVLKADFNDTKMKQALTTVKSKLSSVFAAGASPAREAPALMSDVASLATELSAFSGAIETAKAKYLDNIKATRERDLDDATKKMKNLDAAMDVAVRLFNSEGRNISMAAAVAIEHAAAASKNYPGVTWSRFTLADASERLYRLGGDLPRDLQLRESDGALGAFVAYAATGITGKDANDHLSMFADALSRFEKAKAAADLTEASAIMDEMAMKLNKFGDTVDQMAKHNDPALADAVELSMVVTETVRGVLDMDRRGFDTSRAEDKRRDPRKYERDTKQALAVRRNLASERADHRRKAEERRDPHEAR